jgi:hypothetical protein
MSVVNLRSTFNRFNQGDAGDLLILFIHAQADSRIPALFHSFSLPLLLMLLLVLAADVGGGGGYVSDSKTFSQLLHIMLT